MSESAPPLRPSLATEHMQVKITLDILGWHQRNQLARGRGRRPRLQSNPEKGGEQVSARNRPFTLLLTNASCYPKRLCSGGLLRVMTDPMKGPKRSICFAILWSMDLHCRPLSFSVVFFFPLGDSAPSSDPQLHSSHFHLHPSLRSFSRHRAPLQPFFQSFPLETPTQFS